MMIPERSMPWANAMTKGADESRILNNVKAEKCLEASVAEQYFSALGELGDPETPAEARAMGFQASLADGGQLLCRRIQVPTHLFGRLVHVARGRNLRAILPSSYLDARAIPDFDLWPESDDSLIREQI